MRINDRRAYPVAPTSLLSAWFFVPIIAHMHAKCKQRQPFRGSACQCGQVRSSAGLPLARPSEPSILAAPATPSRPSITLSPLRKVWSAGSPHSTPPRKRQAELRIAAVRMLCKLRHANRLETKERTKYHIVLAPLATTACFWSGLLATGIPVSPAPGGG